ASPKEKPSAVWSGTPSPRPCRSPAPFFGPRGPCQAPELAPPAAASPSRAPAGRVWVLIRTRAPGSADTVRRLPPGCLPRTLAARDEPFAVEGRRGDPPAEAVEDDQGRSKPDGDAGGWVD